MLRIDGYAALRARQDGFTILEILLSVAILVIGLFGIFIVSAQTVR